MHRPARLACAALHEIHRQLSDVAAAFPQRRYAQRDHVEAVEEIGAEAALAYGLVQIAIRGGEHAHVDAHGLVAAHGFELALL